MRWRITRLFRSLVQNTAPKDTRSVFFLFRKVDGEKRERPERTSNSEAFEVLDATLVGSSTRLKRPLAPPRGAAALTAARFDGTSIDPPTGPTTRAYGMARRNHTTRMRGIFIEIRGENRLMPRGIENALDRLKFSLPRFPTTMQGTFSGFNFYASDLANSQTIVVRGFLCDYTKFKIYIKYPK